MFEYYFRVFLEELRKIKEEPEIITIRPPYSVVQWFYMRHLL
jgi:hypothetical protein